MIIAFFKSMFFYCVSLMPLYIIIRYLIRKNKPLFILKEVWYILFFFFSVSIFSQTLIPSSHGRLPFHSINLVPFRTISSYVAELGGAMHTIALYNLVGNTLLFLPFGLFIPSVWKRFDSSFKMMIIAVSIPLFIEFVQLFIGRSVDIDDVILNAIGIFSGYIMLKFSLKIFQTKNMVNHI